MSSYYRSKLEKNFNYYSINPNSLDTPLIFDTISLLQEPLLSYDRWVSDIERLSKTEGRQFGKSLITHALEHSTAVRRQIIENLMKIKNHSKNTHTKKLINQWIEAYLYRFQDLEIDQSIEKGFGVRYNKWKIIGIGFGILIFLNIDLRYLNFFGTGGLFLLLLSIRVIKAYATKSWPTTDGIITKSKLERNTSSDGTTWKADIKYKYVTDNELTYSSTKIDFPLFGGFFTNSTSAGEKGKRATVAKYPMNSKVSVSYDPNNPNFAILEPRVPLRHIIVLLIVGMVELYLIWFFINK